MDAAQPAPVAVHGEIHHRGRLRHPGRPRPDRSGRLVTDYLPELEATGWRGATVQHVLDMTTGVRFSEDYDDPLSDIGQVDVASGWKPVPRDADPSFRWPAHMWELILGLTGTTRPHGAAFQYRSIETDVLAFLMERVSGKRLAELVSEELWQKIGADESACFTVDPAGYALADGGFNATPARLRPLRPAHPGRRPRHRAGRLDRSPPGPAAMARTTTTRCPTAPTRTSSGFAIRKSRTLMARGVFGQLIYIDFDNAMVVVKLSTYPDFTNVAHSKATLAAIDAIAAALAGA